MIQQTTGAADDQQPVITKRDRVTELIEAKPSHLGFRAHVAKEIQEEINCFRCDAHLSEQLLLLRILFEARSNRHPLISQKYEAPIVEAIMECVGLQFQSNTRRHFIPKPDAPEWVTTIPEPNDEEPEVEYQLQAVIGVCSEPCLLSYREYKKLIWTLAKMRGHLQETTGGQGNG